MRFVVSREFIGRHEDAIKIGEQYFALMPLWVKNARSSDAIIVIAHSSEGTAQSLRQAGLKRNKKVLEFIFPGGIKTGYQYFFGYLLKRVIHDDHVLIQIFMSHARKIMVMGVSNDLLLETLFRHLAWYFIDPNTLHTFNSERFEFCKQIADSLLCATLPQGALQ